MERWKINLAVLWFGQFFVLSGMTMIIPFLSLYIQNDLGISNPDEVAWWTNVIYAANFITAFIMQPMWGSVADRYGRKVMLLRSGFGMAVVMTLMGFATNVWQLFLLRVLNGLIAGFVPASNALMSATAPKNRIGFAMGTLQSGAVAGTILGPLLGGVLAEWAGYRPIFYITGASTFAASLLAWLVVKENFVRKEAAGGKKESMAGDFRRLIRAKQVPALFAATIGIQAALQSSALLIPLFVTELHGPELIALYAGIVASVTGFSNMAASPLLGKAADRIGHARVLVFCLAGGALTFVPQAFVGNVWQLAACRFFLGLFMGGMLPAVHALLRLYTPDGMESRAFGYNSSAFSLGNMLGPLLGGILVGWTGIRGLFLAACAMLLANAAWVWATLRGPQPGRGASASASGGASAPASADAPASASAGASASAPGGTDRIGKDR